MVNANCNLETKQTGWSWLVCFWGKTPWFSCKNDSEKTSSLLLLTHSYLHASLALSDQSSGLLVPIPTPQKVLCIIFHSYDECLNISVLSHQAQRPKTPGLGCLHTEVSASKFLGARDLSVAGNGIIGSEHFSPPGKSLFKVFPSLKEALTLLAAHKDCSKGPHQRKTELTQSLSIILHIPHLGKDSSRLKDSYSVEGVQCKSGIKELLLQCNSHADRISISRESLSTHMGANYYNNFEYCCSLWLR